jgi:3-deoxy-D-manno-octulosonic-acid transferase
MPLPPAIRIYRAFTALLSPAAPLLLRRRERNGKEHAARSGERLGEPSHLRPEGRLIWVHGASVGECLAALPLIGELTARGDCHVLVTSGTLTSAKMLETRLPPHAVHQFVPIDTPRAVERFLGHWHPQLGLFVDSDLWPNLLLGAEAHGIKLALINARMSQRSFAGWRRLPAFAARLLACFDACLAQDEEIAARFRALGAQNVSVAGSLKADAPPLAADETNLTDLRRAIAGRPVLLAAQTHSGEEETLLPAHDALRKEFPGLLTVIVPRHTQRAAAIAQLCGTRAHACRSKGEAITPDTAVYIADTMGELGLFYRLAAFTFIGGSLIPHGGQNPLEPAKLGCAVLAGPHVFNFATAYEAIFAAQGLGRVETAAGIAAIARMLLSDPEKAASLGAAAERGAASLSGAVARTVETVERLLSDARA